jgi:lipid A 4'-phosphatase
MHYLSLKRSRIILGAFALSALLFAAFPGIDLYVAKLFYRANGFDRDQGWQNFLHDSLNYFLAASLLVITGLYAFNRLRKRNVLDVDGRKVVYVFLVLILGAGLIVNVVLKDNFGRARPRDVAEFGGAKLFTPAYVVSHECRKNCSFSSGDAAGAFFAIAVVRALTRRRLWLLAALGYGAIVSLGRIYSGAHFLSDTVTSFFVMLLMADALYYFVVLSPAARDEVRNTNAGLKPAYATKHH